MCEGTYRIIMKNEWCVSFFCYSLRSLLIARVHSQFKELRHFLFISLVYSSDEMAG